MTRAQPGEAAGLNAVDPPLQGLLVLDFSQFLAGPSCALRPADLGADVIKVERPQGGDLARSLYLADQHDEYDPLPHPDRWPGFDGAARRARSRPGH